MKARRSEDHTNVAPKKSSDPSVRGAQSSRDGALYKGKTERKKRKVHSALLGDPLLRLPRDPPVHLSGPGFFHIFPLHHPSHPRQSQEAQQVPLPPRVVEYSDAPLPTALPAPHVGCRSCSAPRCETESSSARGRTSIGCPRILIRLRYTAERQWSALI